MICHLKNNTYICYFYKQKLKHMADKLNLDQKIKLFEIASNIVLTTAPIKGEGKQPEVGQVVEAYNKLKQRVVED